MTPRKSQSQKFFPFKMGPSTTSGDEVQRGYGGDSEGSACFPGCDTVTAIYKKIGPLFWVGLLLPIVLILLLVFWSLLRKCKNNNRRQRRRGRGSRRGSRSSNSCSCLSRMRSRIMPEVQNSSHQHYLIILIGVALLYLLGEDENP